MVPQIFFLLCRRIVLQDRTLIVQLIIGPCRVSVYFKNFVLRLLVLNRYCTDGKLCSKKSKIKRVQGVMCLKIYPKVVHHEHAK